MARPAAATWSLAVRQLVRLILVPALVGTLSLSAAWAGAGLAPVDVPSPATAVDTVAAATSAVPAPVGAPAAAAVTQAAGAAQSMGAAAPALPGEATAADAAAALASLNVADGQVLAGAAAVSIEPKPDASKGQVWEKQGCATMGDDAGPATLTHAVATDPSLWPEKPGCIYMGGYGLGPMNPITTWDSTYGLAARSVALRDSQGDTLVLTVLDAASYLGDYKTFCDDCGFQDLAAQLGTQLGIKPEGLLFASTHSHTAPDFIGGWGGVPSWYMEQVAEAMRTSVRQAVANLAPAVVEAGEVSARQFNSERRDFYRSAEDPMLGWFRALELNPGGQPTGKVIATVGSYAAHPVTADESKSAANGDYPVVFNKRVEERFGGVGLFFMTGLGNMSPRGGTEQMGNGLAAAVPPVGAGRVITGDLKVGRTMFDQPVTNPALSALGGASFFDRPMAQTPAVLQVGKGENKPCRSASPISVRTSVSAAKLGSLWITGAPGETFSNLTTTLKERNPEGIVLPLAQVNDGLGYIIQSFEADAAGRQTNAGFVGEVVEYEDAYALDGCFGDQVLEATIALLGTL